MNDCEHHEINLRFPKKMVCFIIDKHGKISTLINRYNSNSNFESWSCNVFRFDSFRSRLQSQIDTQINFMRNVAICAKNWHQSHRLCGHHIKLDIDQNHKKAIKQPNDIIPSFVHSHSVGLLRRFIANESSFNMAKKCLYILFPSDVDDDWYTTG